MAPPTLRELLDYPEYRKYFLTTPYLPECLRLGYPYEIWARREMHGKVFWRNERHPTYRDCVRAVSVLMKAYEDVCVVSRRRSFPMPLELKWIIPTECDWCQRCRRPTIFGKCGPRHHALRKMPVVAPDQLRCWYCAGRQITFGG